MKDEKEKIDFLLQRNIAEQLKTVDWDELNTAISKKLDEAENNKIHKRKHAAVFKIAAGVAAAAALIFVAVMVKTEPLPIVKFEKNGKATVVLKDKAETSVVSIELPGNKVRATVDFEDSSSKLAKCDVVINDNEGSVREDSDQPMWIIISKPKPTVADNGYNIDDELDLICLM